MVFETHISQTLSKNWWGSKYGPITWKSALLNLVLSSGHSKRFATLAYMGLSLRVSRRLLEKTRLTKRRILGTGLARSFCEQRMAVMEESGAVKDGRPTKYLDRRSAGG